MRMGKIGLDVGGGARGCAVFYLALVKKINNLPLKRSI